MKSALTGMFVKMPAKAYYLMSLRLNESIEIYPMQKRSTTRYISEKRSLG